VGRTGQALSAGPRSTQRRAVFLDRDGVLLRANVREGFPYPPNGFNEFEILTGVPEALAELRGAGFVLIVVTNQPDVATGKQRREVVEAMHDMLRRELPLDDIEVCFHTDSDNCICRKPKPGMMLAAGARWSIDLKGSYVVGDRWRDVDSGHASGCTPIFIERNYREALRLPPALVVCSLKEASEAILAGRV
jgi:D-glycero-D-manno-heptose 1,7-bisphosphate phosphatase